MQSTNAHGPRYVAVCLTGYPRSKLTLFVANSSLNLNNIESGKFDKIILLQNVRPMGFFTYNIFGHDETMAIIKYKSLRLNIDL